MPTLVSPANGHTFLSSDVQEFVANATDPEGDAYIADFRLTHETGIQITFSSTSTASGSNATGRPPAKLPSGNYAWQAKARPASGTGFGSDWSAQRTFTVAPAGANASPQAPTLVSPAAGHAYSGGAKQTFTVRAVDPDNDIYRAQIEVERRDALNNLTGYWSFETALAMSDTETSALLNEQLGTGSYRWRARAVDDAGSGAYGLPSDWRSFTVS